MYLLLPVLEFLLLSWSLVVGSWLLVIAVSELGCLNRTITITMAILIILSPFIA